MTLMSTMPLRETIFPTNVKLWGEPYEMLFCLGRGITEGGARVTFVAFFE